MENDDTDRVLQELFARTWTDRDFRQRLLDNPRAVLEARGAQLPPDVEVRAVEETERVIYLVLPMKPTHLSDLDLDQVIAGAAIGRALAAWIPPWLLRAMARRLAAKP